MPNCVAPLGLFGSTTKPPSCTKTMSRQRWKLDNLAVSAVNFDATTGLMADCRTFSVCLACVSIAADSQGACGVGPHLPIHHQTFSPLESHYGVLGRPLEFSVDLRAIENAFRG